MGDAWDGYSRGCCLRAVTQGVHDFCHMFRSTGKSTSMLCGFLYWNIYALLHLERIPQIYSNLKPLLSLFILSANEPQDYTTRTLTSLLPNTSQHIVHKGYQDCAQGYSARFFRLRTGSYGTTPSYLHKGILVTAWKGLGLAHS